MPVKESEVPITAPLSHLMDIVESERPRPGCTISDGIGYGPCLLFSMECGSGGELIAEAVAKRLAWKVYDREIVDHLARLTNLRYQLITGLDERWRSEWDEVFSELTAGSKLTEEQHLVYLWGATLNLARLGDAVIIGRGAQFILPQGCGLRVRCVAPIKSRAKRLAKEEGIPLAQGRARVLRMDEETAHFIKRAFNEDVRSPWNYDIVFDTDTVSVKQAAEIVMARLRE